MLTAARLRELLLYDPGTGLWTWLVDRRGGARAGQPAGSIDSEGYRHITVDGRPYRAARLAWLYMTGEWPADQVDHENLDRTGDRWGNLRPATHGQNQANKALQRNNSTGYKGVYSERGGKFRARIKKDGRLFNLGTFATPHEAAAARNRAAPDLHGEFANSG